MIRIAIAAALGGVVFAAPALAQGQDGYANEAPGAIMTVASPANTIKHARGHHMTNNTAGETSSADKSGQTQEGGAAGTHGTANRARSAHAPGNTGATRTMPANQ